MKIKELIEILQAFDGEKDACIAHHDKAFVTLTEVGSVRDNNGHAQLCTEEVEAEIETGVVVGGQKAVAR